MIVEALDQGTKLRLLDVFRGLADESAYLAEAMRSFGFTVFEPWQQWRSTYCQGSDLETHARCEIETIKEEITEPRLSGASVVSVAAERKREIQAHAMHFSETDALASPPDVRAAYREILCDVFAKYGFEFVGPSRTTSYPVLAKTMVPNWLLCWTNESFAEGSRRMSDKLDRMCLRRVTCGSAHIPRMSQ